MGKQSGGTCSLEIRTFSTYGKIPTLSAKSTAHGPMSKNRPNKTSARNRCDCDSNTCSTIGSCSGGDFAKLPRSSHTSNAVSCSVKKGEGVNSTCDPLRDKKESVSLVWAMSRRNVVNGKILTRRRRRSHRHLHSINPASVTNRSPPPRPRRATSGAGTSGASRDRKPACSSTPASRVPLTKSYGKGSPRVSPVEINAGKGAGVTRSTRSCRSPR